MSRMGSSKMRLVEQYRAGIQIGLSTPLLTHAFPYKLQPFVLSRTVTPRSSTL